MYGSSAEIGEFDHSGFREANNAELIGAGNADFGRIMKELRRLALIVE